VFDPEGPVLGVDPGLTRCGYGAVRRDAAGPTAVSFGVLHTDPADALPERLATLHGDLRALLVDVAPSALAVERLLFQHNVRTAVAVGQASGVVLAAAAEAGVPVTHYSPNEIKLAVAGDGAADKAAVEHMVARMLRLDATPQSPDAADALALALCHAWGAPLREIVGAAAARASSGGADGSAKEGGRLREAIDRALASEDAS
jgi:crossover junction endodeoxyribonuclease RuvC